MSKTFFTHTTKLEVVKQGYIPAATIALKRVGDVFYYGVAICSKYDNFSKKHGREVAESRMNRGFGSMQVPEVLEGLDEKTSCLAQLYQLASTVVVKNRKWKRRVTKFNMEQEKGAKVINIKTEIRPLKALNAAEYFKDRESQPQGDFMEDKNPTNRA